MSGPGRKLSLNAAHIVSYRHVTNRCEKTCLRYVCAGKTVNDMLSYNMILTTTSLRLEISDIKTRDSTLSR